MDVPVNDQNPVNKPNSKSSIPTVIWTIDVQHCSGYFSGSPSFSGTSLIFDWNDWHITFVLFQTRDKSSWKHGYT